MAALLRLTEIERGAICLAGQDVRSVPLAALRQRIGYVPQATFLFEVCPCQPSNITECRHALHVSRRADRDLHSRPSAKPVYALTLAAMLELTCL